MCLTTGVVGLVIAGRNFTFLAQDADLMPATMALDQATKQPWLDFGCSMLPIGVAGLILLPFCFRLKTVPR